MHVAVDLLGGAPVEQILESLAQAVANDPDLTVTVVGAAAPGLPAAASFLEAAVVVSDDHDPLAAVRASRAASVRVAHRLVRDGLADAVVTTAPLRVAHAGAVFGLGLLPGATEVAYGSRLGDSVYVEAAVAGGGVDALAQQALGGLAIAEALGIERPSVGALAADPDVLAALRHLLDPATVEAVGAHALTSGSHGNHVLVADPATAQLARAVALAAIEDFVAKVSTQLDAAAISVLHDTRALEQQASARRVLLGVQGVSVCSDHDVEGAIALARALVETHAVADLAARLQIHVDRRRRDAGLTA